MYVQPCEDNSDDDDEVMCTGERKGERKGEGAPVCCPFEFEEPITCTEIDVKMECDNVEILPKDFPSIAENTPTATSPSIYLQRRRPICFSAIKPELKMSRYVSNL